MRAALQVFVSRPACGSSHTVHAHSFQMPFVIYAQDIYLRLVAWWTIMYTLLAAPPRDRCTAGFPKSLTNEDALIVNGPISAMARASFRLVFACRQS